MSLDKNMDLKLSFCYFDQLVIDLHAEVGRSNVDVDAVLAYKEQFQEVYPDVDAYFGAVNAQLEAQRAPRNVRLNWATTRETYRLRYQGIMRRLDRLEEVMESGQRLPDSEIEDLAAYVESALPDPFDA